MTKLAKHFELRFKVSGDEAEVMEALAKAIAEVEGVVVMPFLEMRAARLSEADGVDQQDVDIMATDEVQECLCKFDQAEFSRLVKVSANAAKTAASCVAAVRTRREVSRQAAAPVAPAKRGRGAAKSSGKAVPVRIVLPPGAVTQAEAKLLSPPGSYIWRNTSSQALCGKMPPISRSWMAHGHRGSCIKVLRVLW